MITDRHKVGVRGPYKAALVAATWSMRGGGGGLRQEKGGAVVSMEQRWSAVWCACVTVTYRQAAANVR
jgi:hypothetical protein